jgi:hypothetical protein
LAHRLAQAVRCPAICRDEVKEGLVNAMGEIEESREDLQRNVYDAFFDAIEPLREIADIRMIRCTIDPQLARARHIARGLADPERERFHGDRPVVAAREGRELPIGEYEPPRLDVPTLCVDTTEEYKPAFDDCDVCDWKGWKQIRVGWFSLHKFGGIRAPAKAGFSVGSRCAREHFTWMTKLK